MINELLTREELEESLHLFRATIKLSSSLTNIDNLNDEECLFFKTKMKMDFLNFSDWIERHVRNLIIAYTEENPDILTDIMYWFTEIEDHLEMDDPYEKDLLMFLCKILSACNDLISMSGKLEYSEFISPIIGRVDALMHKGYVRKFEFLNIHHPIFKSVIEQMDEMGKKVII